MRLFQSRNRFKNNLYSKVSLAVLVVLVGLLTKSVWDIYEKSAVTQVNRERVVAELAQLQDRQKDLSGRIAALNTDRGVEAEVRRNLSVVKEGEKVITIVDTATTTGTKKVSWWRRWVGLWR